MDFTHICPNCYMEAYYNGVCRKCGYTHEERSDRALPLFSLLADRYLIGKVIGAGGFGITYKGLDIQTNTVCAVKEYIPMNVALRPRGSCNVMPADASQKSYFLHGQERFTEEAVMLRRLSHISEIVNITDQFSENGTSYFVMEYLDGQNLKQYYREQRGKGKMIPYEFCRRIMIGIGNALNELHTSCKIFHRDISPENIFITSDGGVKLIDFGNAKHCTKEESQNISVVLKPGFAPPEQYSSKGVQGPWTDIYSLACTFYLIAGGEAVPSAPDRLSGVGYKPLYELNSLVTRQVSDAIDRALQLNYKQRTKNISDLIRVFGAVAQSASAAPAPKPSYSENKTPYLKVISGDCSGSIWALPYDTEISVGRIGGKCQAAVSKKAQVSGTHCMLKYSRQYGGFLIKDVSTNGTFIGKNRLEKNKYYLIKAKTAVSIAGDVCEIEIGVE